MSKYIVYKYTSKTTGKSYIGQTLDLSKRVVSHRHHSSSCTYFRNAIKKYGWEDFVLEILAENLTLEEANNIETASIEEQNTLAPNGYNLKTGGSHGEHSVITKQKISEHNARKGIPNPNKGRTDFHTEETKQLISEYSKARHHSDESKEKIRQARLGVCHSDATKQKISEHSARRGKPAPNKGVPHSEETKAKLKIARQKRPKKEPAPVVICPRCGKQGHQGNMMNRWHFDNCLSKP